jgi:chromosomal replication initiation ATPase DnaA
MDQKIIKFTHEKNLKDSDFFVSKSNKHVHDFLLSWPNWEKNLVNICGENFSGKSHLINIFIKKFKGVIFKADTFDNDNLSSLDIHQNIVLENLNNKINEKLIYTLINTVEQNGKYLIITSYKSISKFNFNLNDLRSRAKNFLIQDIQKPDDELIFALLIKNLSDRQILIEKKLLNYIVKRIHRSYSKIFDFIYKIDEMSLKKKKPININLVKEILGE